MAGSPNAASNAGISAVAHAAGSGNPAQTFLGDLQGRLAREDPAQRRQSRRVEARRWPSRSACLPPSAPRGAPGCRRTRHKRSVRPGAAEYVDSRVRRPTRAFSITSASACRASAAMLAPTSGWRACNASNCARLLVIMLAARLQVKLPAVAADGHLHDLGGAFVDAW